MLNAIDAAHGNLGRLTLDVSREPRPDADLLLTFHMDDPDDDTASIYLMPDGQEVWLCGWLLWYFRGKPSQLAVTIN